MVNIIYRHYQKGDDEQLADLFNRAFQMNGFGFVRTPKNWKWRYFNSPGFEAEMIQIAEDIESNKIVGQCCGCHTVVKNLLQDQGFLDILLFNSSPPN